MPSAHAMAMKSSVFQMPFNNRSTSRTHGECRFRWARRTALLLLTGVAAGCGPGGPPLVAVSGKLTLGGAPWPKPGMVYFASLTPAEGQPKIPGTAEVAADGTFRAKCSRGEGLVPGTYKVSFECWEQPPGTAVDPPPVSYLAEEYQRPHTSPVEINVELDTPLIIERDLPRRE